jgi:hypothetical protein
MSIHGKVAVILNERDLVINKGHDDGVSEGMLFKVTQPNVSITDPDSGAELGVLTREKIKVKVFEVHQNFSVAKTYETYSTSEPSAFEFADALHRRRTVTRVRKILIEPSEQASVTIGVSGSTVNVGDPVVEITE